QLSQGAAQMRHPGSQVFQALPQLFRGCAGTSQLTKRLQATDLWEIEVIDAVVAFHRLQQAGLNPAPQTLPAYTQKATHLTRREKSANAARLLRKANPF